MLRLRVDKAGTPSPYSKVVPLKVPLHVLHMALIILPQRPFKGSHKPKGTTLRVQGTISRATVGNGGGILRGTYGFPT